MPLEHSSSDAALHRNMATLMGEIGKSPHVQSRAQAQAIAFETQRRGRAIGGVAPNVGFGNPVMGAPSGVTSPGITPPMGAPSGIQPAMMPPTQVPQGMPGVGAPAVGAPAPSPWVGAPAPMGAPAGLGGSFPFMARSGMGQAGIPMGMPGMGSMGAPSNVLPAGVAAPGNLMGRPMMMNSGGALHRDMGGFSMQRGPHLAPSWQTKQEARGMMHTGPVMSPFPGRTDVHNVKIPSGGYVFPSQHVASLGQGNTLSGMAVLNQMFHSGPYGSPSGKLGHGAGLPKPPHPMKYSEGGPRGDDIHHEPVDCIVAGGEYIAHPQDLIRKFGNLKRAHKILDKWVMDTRKKEIETQKNLPEPAKK